MKKTLSTLSIFCLVIVFLGSLLYQAQAQNLEDRLKGKILLQVESRGEAWYVNPDNKKLYPLGKPSDAIGVMRELGLGVSNKDFQSFGKKAPERLAGKFLLKVEDKGKAFYVNPDNLEMHYLGGPVDALKVMRDLGLGISNDNIAKIPVNNDNDSPSVAQAPAQTQTGQTEECEESNIREYACPHLLEFEFTRPENLSSLAANFVSAGPPILRFSHAEVEDDKLACVYDNKFAESNVSSADDDEFAFFLSSANDNCPNFLGFNIRDKENIAPDWKILYPGYLKVDKIHSGQKGVVMLLWQSEVDWAHTYNGCVYSKTLQQGSDPTLRIDKYGVCIVNDDNNGFKCANTLTELYGKTMEQNMNVDLP